MCGGHARFFPPYLRRGLAAENISPTLVSCRQPECIGKAATHLRLQCGCSKQAPVLCRRLRLALRFTCKLKETTRADERTRTADLLQLRVISHVLQRFAQACKCPISKGFSFLGLALGCTVLRSRWYQSGINVVLVYARQGCPYLAPFDPPRASLTSCD